MLLLKNGPQMNRMDTDFYIFHPIYLIYLWQKSFPRMSIYS
jgi:hypothetical protein